METLPSFFSAVQPSHLALFGAIFASLVLVVGMVLSRTDIRALEAHAGSRIDTFWVPSLTPESSSEFALLHIVTRLLDEAVACKNAGAMIAATAISYMVIDAMAFLAMPMERTSARREDIVQWVDRYFQARVSENKLLSGDILYDARCQLLDGFLISPAAQQGKLVSHAFSYVTVGRHEAALDGSIIINVLSLIDDLATAVDAFVGTWHVDEDLRNRATPRLAKLNDTIPIWQGVSHDG